MVRLEQSIEIKAFPEKVWEMLALDRLPEWMDEMEMKSGKYTSEVRKPKDKYKVGASAHIIEKRWEYDLSVLESLTNEKLVCRSKGKYILTMTFILKSVDEGTRFTLVGEYELPWGILGKAIGGLIRGTEEKQGRKGLEKLKKILEK